MARKMVTTGEAVDILKGRGLSVSHQTVWRWAKSKLFAGAKLEQTPRGGVWLIPEDAVKSFEPPKKGRPFTKKGVRKSARAKAETEQ
jgi:hypothetical protein